MSSSTWITQNNIDNNCFGDRFDARRGLFSKTCTQNHFYVSFMASSFTSNFMDWVFFQTKFSVGVLLHLWGQFHIRSMYAIRPEVSKMPNMFFFTKLIVSSCCFRYILSSVHFTQDLFHITQCSLVCWHNYLSQF